MKQPHQALAPARGQRGAVLVVALILLLAVSLIGVLAIRSAITGEQVAKSLRSHAAALQSAELALRYCEDQLIHHTGGPLIVLPIPDQEQWKTRAHWQPDGAKVNAVPADVAGGSDGSARRPADAFLPRCMVETLRLPMQEGGPSNAYRVTAVGYSTDYREDAGARPMAGGEAWLQSVVRQ